MKDLNRGITAGLMIVLAGCVVISGAHAKQGSGHGPAPFSDFDMDGNGLVSEAEFYSLREQRMAARASEGKEMRCAQFSPSFADLDKDGDGQLSADELSAGQQTHMAKCKEMRKGDGKGKGMQGNMPQFSDFDLDGDGFITETEFNEGHASKMSELAASGHQMKHAVDAPGFAAIDTDGDGKISKHEFSEHQAAHHKQMHKHQKQHEQE
ncbi:MAG: EF-hand domain-containing protein [Xanthomonadales bacterium]|nr:EF-hand domain-containing protein [Xanthomonadales bacterium]MDH4021388.1 EF-hand domain-containing protein [Xanthomonadales bacterium]